MIGRTIGPLALLLVLAGLWVANCSGPRPSVADVQVTAPRAEGEPYLVGALIRNEGRGHGEVKVSFRLRDRASGQTVEQGAKVDLEDGETTRLVVEIQAPPGDYAPMVEAIYPPR